MASWLCWDSYMLHVSVVSCMSCCMCRLCHACLAACVSFVMHVLLHVSVVSCMSCSSHQVLQLDWHPNEGSALLCGTGIFTETPV